MCSISISQITHPVGITLNGSLMTYLTWPSFLSVKQCIYWWYCVWWSAVEGEGKDQMNLVCPNLYAQMAEITRKIGWKVYLNFSWLHWRGYLITQKSHIKIISLLCLERGSKKSHQYFMSTYNCEIKWLDKFTSYYVC